MTPLVDDRWCGTHGIGRFATEVLRRFPDYRSLGRRSGLLGPMDPIRLSWMVWKEKPDVYFSPGFNPPVIARSPIVFTIHDLIHLADKSESSPAKLAYYRLVVRPAARRARAVITVSEHSKGEIVAWAGIAPEQVIVVGNGVSPAFTSSGPAYRPGYPYILYVGNLKPHKNVVRLLEAFSEARIDPATTLLIASEPAEAIVRDAERLELTERVIFRPGLADETLAAYYRGARMLAIPSLNEGFGLPALEAMACGVPVLAARAGALPEVLGDAGLLVDPQNVHEIAEAIEALDGDAQLGERLRHQGPIRARAYSWDRTSARVWRALERASLA